jgi:hypothetical protein
MIAVYKDMNSERDIREVDLYPWISKLTALGPL